MKKVTSRAELKIIQLELRLEPAWLGLITSNYLGFVSQSSCSRKAVVRQLPGSHQAGRCQATIRNCSGSNQPDIRQSSVSHQIVQPMGLKAFSVLFFSAL